MKHSFLCNPLRWVGAPGNTPLLDPMYSICISNIYGVTFPDLDAVALPHGDPHGHGDRRDEAAEDVQQGETEALPVFLAGWTGEAGKAPESKTTWGWMELRWMRKPMDQLMSAVSQRVTEWLLLLQVTDWIRLMRYVHEDKILSRDVLEFDQRYEQKKNNRITTTI